MLIEVLGPVRLSTDEGVPVKVAERKSRLVLAALVAAEGEPVSTDVLVDRLWAERLPANPRNVLRVKLSQIRNCLDAAQPGARELLERTPAGYRLVLGPEVVDAARFKSAVEHARTLDSPARKVQALREALVMWRGEPYGDLADEVWLAPTIADLIEVRGAAIELLVETLVEVGEPQQAIDHANGAVLSFPTRERLVRALMLGLYQVGRQHEALEVFESLRYRLAEDLGVDPSPQVRELHERILSQDPALSAAADPDAADATPARTNVPAEMAPLIGRHREASHVGTMLGDSRLVTLTGIGGVGKTRLALHIAREQAEEFDRGTWFLDLTELTRTPEDQLGSSDRIAALLSTAMGLPGHAGTAGDLERVSQVLGSRAALLVLDNCEHVVVEAAVFAAEILRSAPGVRVLATSREPLGLPDEHRYDLDTLSTEPSEDGPSEAVEFFTARARAIDPTFALTEATGPTVAELCRRLDGLPLALELAAGRLRGISVAELLERLSQRLNILKRPGRGVPRRQQTLRGMIDWSWSLLDQSEKVVLRRLAVHPGSLSLAAAEAICADTAIVDDREVVEPTDVADVLIALVDRSLVTTTSSLTGSRYGLLESIATYAAEKLDQAGEREACASAHLSFYIDFARRADEQLRGGQQREWLSRLESKRTQIRHALRHAVQRDDGHSAVALTVATFWYHWISGRQADLHTDFHTVTSLTGPRDDDYAAAATLAVAVSLELEPGREVARVEESLALFDDDLARAWVQWFAGTSLLAIGVREAGERHVDQAIVVLDEHGADWGVAIAACLRDWFLVSGWGESPRGLPNGRDPEEILGAIGDGYGLSQALSVEHRVAETGGDHRRAAETAERAIAVCLDLGLWSEASYWFTASAMAALGSGEVGVASERVARARSLADDFAYTHGLRFADFADSMIARYLGDTARARRLLDRWTSFRDSAGSELLSQLEHGFLAIEEGEFIEATSALDALASLVGDPAASRTGARMLELAAALRAARANAQLGAELLGTASAVRDRAEAGASAPERRDIDRINALLREQLTVAQVSKAIERGRGLDPTAQLDGIIADFSRAGA